MSAQASEALLREAVVESVSDPSYFCRFFLRKWFKSEMPWFHLGLLALITRKVSFLDKYPEHHALLIEHFRYMDTADPMGERTLPIFYHDAEGHMCMMAAQNNNFILPRGFSKTTLCNAGNLYSVLTDPNFFGAYVSETLTHARTQLDNIRYELENNHLIRTAYGNLVPDRSDSERWTAGELQMLNGAILIARGRGSQIRGVNFRSRRPNFILLDDVEDEESVKSPERREETRKWAYGGVMPAGNEMDGADDDDQDPLMIVSLATLLDGDALCVTLSKDIEFNTVRFGARIRPGLMLWEYKMTEATYERKRARYAGLGRLAEFCREYDSTIRVSGDALFQHHNVTLYLPVVKEQLIAVAMAMDPAISEKADADSAVIAVAGRGPKGLLWVLDMWGGVGKTPRDKVNMFFTMYERWFSPHYMLSAGIESQGYQHALIHLMREEMARKRKFFHIEPIIQGPTQTKVERINGILQPRYAAAYMRHARPFPELETQLQDFPNGKKDWPDALAMALKLLGETAFTAADIDNMDDEGPWGNEYQPLDEALPPFYSAGNLQFSHNDPLRGRYG